MLQMNFEHDMHAQQTAGIHVIVHVCHVIIVCHVMYMYDISYTCHVCIRPGIGVSGMHAAYGVRVRVSLFYAFIIILKFYMHGWIMDC